MCSVNKNNASFSDVRKAIFEQRLKVFPEEGKIFTRRKGAKAQWRECTYEIVHPPARPKSQYLRISFSYTEGSFRCLAHRVIWFVAHGNIANGLTINHKDGNKRNNCLCNLELCTNAENHAHAIENGLWQPRSSTMRKLSAAQVHELRDRVKRA